jgi:hypothetical protein
MQKFPTNYLNPRAHQKIAYHDQIRFILGRQGRLNPHKSTDMLQHKQNEGQSHTMITTSTEKPLDKIHHGFIIKTLKK